MRSSLISSYITSFLLSILIVSCEKNDNKTIGNTEVMKWQYGKRAAVSLTYDGGTINQFQVALPIMNRLNFPSTFFIVTGEIQGSKYLRKFIGRSLNEIIRETVNVPTDKNNFIERASAIRVAGDEKIIEYHTRAGDLWEVGKFEEAYQQIDNAYSIVRSDPDYGKIYNNQHVGEATWDELKVYAAQGHEFASHSVSHPQFGILDDANMVYELDKSKEEILNNLGPEHTFSIECPYGTENERVMDFTFKRYPAVRNRMPEPFLEEINRWNDKNPGTSIKEYVQWQRGPLTETPIELMQSWIDTCTVNNNIWLVLVFHGVEGIGWEPVPGNILETFFNYIRSNENKIWVATFQDVTKYIRERMNSVIKSTKIGNSIHVELNHNLDPELYNLPLTLKTYVPSDWESVKVKQGEKYWSLETRNDKNGDFVLYQALPNVDGIIITRGDIQ